MQDETARRPPGGRSTGFARTTGRALTGTAKATGSAARRASLYTGRKVRKATHSGGAGESGLGRLIELHALNMACDTFIAISLADTLFFSVSAEAARSKVALYLLITMAPFSVMAPIVGPVLDHFRRGRRYAIATTFIVRGFLAWTMAGAIGEGGLGLYPAAFGVLVASKAYGVTRSAAVPRLLPRNVTLVKANSRITLAGLLATAVAAPAAVGIAQVGSEWSLRLVALMCIAATFVAVALPKRVDSAEGEERAHLRSDGETEDTPRRARLRNVGPSVVVGLRANATVRAFSGFLTMFLAFLLRKDPIGGVSPTVMIGLVAIAAAVGGMLGTSIGAWLRARAPEAIILGVLAVEATAAVVAAILYGLWSVLAIAVTAGLAQALGKLSLDALIQRDIPELIRTSAFARSETLLQLSWVVGGAVGIVLPLRGDLGLGLAAAGVVVTFVLTVRSLRGHRIRGRPAAFAHPD